MATRNEGGVPLSTVSPKFLITNATSHTSPFSAIAELIDNAYDPDVNAKQLWIDKTQIKDKECLTFMDNGNGVNYDRMHQMLSFGYSDKKTVNGKQPIGKFGNGFKSGSMRLGDDAIVLSKSKKDLCVGMLSQSYLRATRAKQITVPIVSIQQTPELSVLEEHRASLKDILQYSPFNTEEELLTELQAISSTGATTGSRIIIWNLRRKELDFTTDRYDIRIPSDADDSTAALSTTPNRSTPADPNSDFSLRAYCRVLYLKPRMQINIRGQKVKTELISKSLAHVNKDFYKPSSERQNISITFGYNTKSKGRYGLMMYYKNRLIKGYHRIGCQLNANKRQGIGVIGVVVCNFLEPTHSKQDFVANDIYRNTIKRLAIKLEEYWKEIQFKRKKKGDTIPIEDTEKTPDQNWVQCDGCQKWRKMPDGFGAPPEVWYCYLNQNPEFRRCEIEEEPVDSDSEQPTNRRTYKIQEKEDQKKMGPQTSTLETPLPRPQTPRVGPSGKMDLYYLRAHNPSTSSSHLVKRDVVSLSKTPSRASLQSTTSLSESKRPMQNSLKRKLDISMNSSTIMKATANYAKQRRHTRAPIRPWQPGRDGRNPSGLRSGNIFQAQEPNGQLSGLMQSTSVERDSLREKVAKAEALSRKKEALLQQNQEKAKKIEEALLKQNQEKAKQIEDLVCSLDQIRADMVKLRADKSLFQQAREKAEALSRKKEALLQQNQEKAKKIEEALLQQNQEKAKQIEDLVCSLDQSRADMVKLCEDKSLFQQAREKAEALSREKEALLQQNQEKAKQIEEALLQQNQEKAKQIEHLVCSLDQSRADMVKLFEDKSLFQQAREKAEALSREKDALLQQNQEKAKKIEEALLQQNQEKAKQIEDLVCSLDQSRADMVKLCVDKRMFHQAKEKAEALSREKEALLQQNQEKAKQIEDALLQQNQEKAKQIEDLLCSLDQSRADMVKLQIKVNRLEEDASLSAEREQIRLREEQEAIRERHSSTQTTTGEAGDSAETSMATSGGTNRRLVELRHNVARLLLRYVPLELDQVNFECNVIDEILEQFLDENDPAPHQEH